MMVMILPSGRLGFRWAKWVSGYEVTWGWMKFGEKGEY